MAIYSYYCGECKTEIDLMRAMKDSNKIAWCEKCGSQMKRTIETPGKMIRGSGGWSTPS